ncbi:phosphatidylinositol-specific phospholipase C [Allosalinactinospora lopnorensis]|uniref:phosphatidylinositol-specific phospholipase C n=1 Tax=Allosalinactinospora lopnorensis TaxID=1352348 RepID=UPI0009E30A81|nr:phosphatidylinositol-specific phospholipase C [Allosalinactinospora lopnorensis]
MRLPHHGRTRRRRDPRGGSPERSLRAVSVAIVAVLMIVLLPATPAWADARHSQNLGDTSHPDWMSLVPDDTDLAALSIPGTHDTMARGVTPAANTQDSGLPEQLGAGIRALDIRARHHRDVFPIHHGRVYLNANFTDVLRDTTDFLKEHPTETVLMRLKEEYRAEENTRSFAETLEWYLNDNPDTADLAREHLWSPGGDGRRIPTLGEARGKIVLLQDFNGDGAVYGPRWGGPAMDIQDEYRVPTIFDIDDKWHKARAHFEKTGSGDSEALSVNFLSGAGVGAYPKEVARGVLGLRGVNDFALQYLFERNVSRTGVVMMDYPGAGLVDAVVAHNFRLAGADTDVSAGYGRMLGNIAHSAEGGGDGAARERGRRLLDFLDHVLPDRNWHLLVWRGDFRYNVAYSGLYARTPDVGGYRYAAFTSANGGSGISEEELGAFVDAEVEKLSGGVGERTEQLVAKARESFPGHQWSAAVKREPGGFGNWAVYSQGTSYLTWESGYGHLVWGYAG